MLEIRPGCECCDRDLPPDATDAYVCTFECTWCADCVDRFPARACPNCGGTLERRPVRPPDALLRHPAATRRTVSPCAHGPGSAPAPAADEVSRSYTT
ncbi:DUF1272 domain-containing protein [Cellulomonas shaoxiangyii]|uniref:DUF1272 domain-containing protein n=1 Tax=Cellulomonas shaoxiangyii TaxID=2566013 RepID=A0A4P7SH63_9CELL|nr:DUF1272 domain-containing protein [Cellulomonas shaoxiangyii]QCB93539.1 DUF1272 domain-containing protein [Cellulomonas shaoxiangyii]TGY86861.1 DUF1272 domain-containing protein [Cellulomonas shaoxiangyii]